MAQIHRAVSTMSWKCARSAIGRWQLRRATHQALRRQFLDLTRIVLAALPRKFSPPTPSVASSPVHYNDHFVSIFVLVDYSVIPKQEFVDSYAAYICSSFQDAHHAKLILTLVSGSGPAAASQAARKDNLRSRIAQMDQ